MQLPMFIYLVVLPVFVAVGAGDVFISATGVITNLTQPALVERWNAELASAFPTEPTYYLPQVIAEFPHDTDSYTQGLLLHDGILYESDGGNEAWGTDSSLRSVDIETGEIIQLFDVPEPYFAEGLALFEDQLIQLTWQDGKAFVYDRTTFRLLGAFDYEGQGWGLCYDGRYLYMTDGSSTVFVREPDSFEIVHQFDVRFFGEPIQRLNELECVGNEIYANVYTQNYIVRFNKFTGNINAVIYGDFLLTEAERAQLLSDEVLNGIAYDPENDIFYLTGKNWPKLFATQLVEVQLEE